MECGSGEHGSPDGGPALEGASGCFFGDSGLGSLDLNEVGGCAAAGGLDSSEVSSWSGGATSWPWG